MGLIVGRDLYNALRQHNTARTVINGALAILIVSWMILPLIIRKRHAKADSE
jgi:hypothetical protein